MQTNYKTATTSLTGTYWQWRGHSVYYVQSGVNSNQRPPLLLVHGFGASTDHWRKNLDGLKQDFQVWAIDLLGFGRSAKPNLTKSEEAPSFYGGVSLTYSGDLWRDQLDDFITEVIGQPVVLAGNSLGGYACLCVAAQKPESATGLILLNSAGPFTDSKPQQKPNSLQNQISKLTRFLFLQPWASYLLFQYLRRPTIIRKTLEKVYLDRSAITDQLVEDIYRPSCDRGAADVFASVFKTPQGEKIDVLLQQMSCPLLMIWGEADPWMKAKERGAKFRQYYPSITEYYLKAGHCPHDEVPDQVNALITSWVLNFFCQ
jgi:pimeloyl-ACP methyl ester carboxylesterase